MDKMLWQGHKDFQEFISLVDGRECEISIKPLEGEKLRTALQNKAMHKDMSNTAKVLNDNNVSAKDLFSCARSEIGITDRLIKEFWYFVMEEGFGLPPKTSKLSTRQVTEVREVIARAISVRLGVDIGDLPSLESMSSSSLINEHRSSKRND